MKVRVGALRNPSFFRRLRIISHESKEGYVTLNPMESSAHEIVNDNISGVMRGHGAVM